MAVQRFVLDSTTLDNAGFGLAGGAAFILDTSTLDGAAVLDGGQFLTVATGSSSLGGISASASAQATIFPVLSSSLGGLVASATARSTIFPVLSSSLGGLVGSATAQSSQPEPPYIPPSGSRWWKQPASPVVKHEPPEQVVIQVPKPRLPLFVSAVAMAQLGGADVGALGSITFSTLDDDAEVLLLI